jgi:hypothetical protein
MELLQTAIGWFGSLPLWVNAISGIVAAAATLAALTPTPADDTFLAKIRTVIDWLGLNVLNAKNAKTPPSA